MSTIDRIAIRRVAVERATVISGPSFDAVLAKLAAGLPYQTLIASLLHKYASGRLKDV